MLLERTTVALERIADALTDIAANYNSDTKGEPDSKPEAERRRARKPKDTGASAAAVVTDAPAQAQTGIVAEGDQAKAPAAVAQAQAEITTPAAQAAAPAAQAASYEPLKAAVIELANSGGEGKAAAINILSKYGVKKASEAAPEKWPAMLADFQAELAKLKGEDEFA